MLSEGVVMTAVMSGTVRVGRSKPETDDMMHSFPSS